ncbi:MAG: three-Cys-motif partner protein TcmP [Nostocales cyanobacterium]|nr:MAG: three-Cys-motif partner protein TcmP [Nostocales cyanobacterium]TAF14053.1 MAG: three-Cys-motif partner protein TcmP [Nostocales cyanobacterium]
MTEDTFFESPSKKSNIKIQIVTKYFPAWAKIIVPRAKKKGIKKVGYIDLFSGPGIYKDGSKSTPVFILETAINDPDLREMLVTFFNDKKLEHFQSLQEVINAISGINSLRYQPKIYNMEVSEEITHIFKQTQFIPTLFFIDPYGYKGLSLELINSAIEGWGCDCIFFFNYNRINQDLNNKKVLEYIDSLFGKERANHLREEVKNKQPEERELAITEAIKDALQDIGGSYIQEFCFEKDDAARTSHYIIFVSKNKIGLNIIKDIMGNLSSSRPQGVPSFEYTPPKVRQLSIFDYENSRPLDDLQKMLLDEFAGQTIKMIDIYNQHHVGKKFISKNYKDALKNLESQGKITVNPPYGQRKKRKGEVTFGDSVRVTFPPK